MIKKFPFLSAALLLLIIAVACTEKPTSIDNNISAEQDALTSRQLAAREHMNKKNKEAGIEAPLKMNKTEADISYSGSLCDGVTPGETSINGVFDPALWNYYSFFGNAGDIIDITVNRTTTAMDASFVLFFGTTNTSDGLAPDGSTNPDMEWVLWQDDDFYSPLGGCFLDPELIGFALPYTGTYTLAVWDYFGCGPGPLVPFEIVLSGVSCFMSQKAATIDALASLMPSGEKTDKKIEKAIEKIQKSLNPEYWVDENHLDPKKGKKVFDEEKKAVKELEKVLKDKDADPGLKDAVTSITATLVSIDEQLALKALSEIEGACVTEKCEKEIEKVYKELGKAAEEIAKEHLDHAIDKYKKAWEHTQHAIKHNIP